MNLIYKAECALVFVCVFVCLFAIEIQTGGPIGTIICLFKKKIEQTL
jgi:hypothetical protein